MSIYSEVATLQAMFEEVIDPETGEIINEKEFDLLNILQNETVTNGISRLCKVYANLKAQADAIKAEKARIAEKQKTAENAVDRLKQYIKLIMQKTGNDKLTDGSFKVALRLSEAVNITDESKLASEYMRVSYEPNKTAIKADLKAGKVIDGAELTVNTNVVIS